HGHLSEGRRWLTGALAGAPASAVPAPMRARALLGAGLLAYEQSDLAAAETLFDESLALFRSLNDRQGIALLLAKLGMVARVQCDFARAAHLNEASLALAHELGDRPVVAFALLDRGTAAR